MKIEIKISEFNYKNLDNPVNKDEVLYLEDDADNISKDFVWLGINGKTYTVNKKELFKSINSLTL